MSALLKNARYQKIQSHIRRNEWKKAYNETIFLSKQIQLPEIRALLVSTLWNWIKDQVRQNQYDDAKKNVQELLRQSEIAAEIRAEFPPVFRILGLNALLPEDQRQNMASPEIQIELVDRFLIRGTTSNDLLPETQADAQRILSAFQKIEAKQDAEALELLHPIAFRSPLAEWRLFLRGLIDHYNGNSEKAEESWRRLSPDRPPFRIVGKLRQFLSEKPSSVPQGILASIFSLFRKQSSTDSSHSAQSRRSELPDTLRILDGYLKQGKYKELLGRFQSSKALFQQELPIVFERLLRVVHLRLLYNASPDILRQFIDRNLPLPLDPKGNRTLALLSEYTYCGDSQFSAPRWLEHPPVYWQKFIEDDIDQISSFSPKMKARAKAIIYNHLAKETMDEYMEDLNDADGDEEKLSEVIDVARAKNGIEGLAEKAIACDPTYVASYRNLQCFYLAQSKMKGEKIEIHPRCKELDEQLLKHVPDAKDSLLYLFEYHLNNRDAKSAKPYNDKLCELDPLSQETRIRRARFNTARLREGIRHRDFQEVDAAIADTNSGPSLESMFYRFDLLPLAFGYIADALRNNDQNLGNYFSFASPFGIEKRLPLVFAIIVEGRELDLPPKYLEPLEAEWAQTITGRCNGNTAAVLGDAAYNFALSPERYPKSQNLIVEAQKYVNRAGQVKWNSEKDLFCATNLLWYLAVEKQDADYEKTFGTLSRKGRKQFPKSLWFFFFETESQHGNSDGFGYFPGSWRHRQANAAYQEFLQRLGSMRNDMQFTLYALVAEQRLDRLNNPGGNWLDDDDDDDDDDWDDDDDDDWDEADESPFDFPPEIRRMIKRNGGIPKEVKKELAQKMPAPGPLAELMVDALEECVLKGISTDNVPKIMEQKMKNMPMLQRMKLMVAMARVAPGPGFDSDDDDSSPPPDKSKKRKK